MRRLTRGAIAVAATVLTALGATQARDVDVATALSAPHLVQLGAAVSRGGMDAPAQDAPPPVPAVDTPVRPAAPAPPRARGTLSGAHAASSPGRAARTPAAIARRPIARRPIARRHVVRRDPRHRIWRHQRQGWHHHRH